MKIQKLRVGSPAKFKLQKRAADETFGVSKADAAKQAPVHAEKLRSLQELLYAESKRSLLIVLQGMDAAGKDGVITHVMSGVNPQGCAVTSFKQPSAQELSHDFLWRIHAAVPPKGSIGIFNRSQYEDVLVARVHDLVPKEVWQRRYDQINAFEKILTQNCVHILKFFLHISSGEQKKRLEARIEDPRKNWKSSAADFKEREYWDQYQKAYADALVKCDTSDAPWYIIPGDHKWFRNYAVGEVIVQTLESLKMQFPTLVP
ncbi:MAG: polyphosphate kinase 2 family protein [Acidobacteriota bacterium]|nr:polyphosphate kinase 2 family protein [Acidobacteriota bacterium]